MLVLTTSTEYTGPLLNGAIARAPDQLKQDSQIDSRTLSVPKSTAPSASDSKTPSGPNSRTPGVHVAKGSVVFLSCIIQLPLINAYGTVTTLRAMLDTGSQVEIISKSAAEKLVWDITGKPVSIRGVGGGKLKTTLWELQFPIMLPGGQRYTLTCHVVDDLVGELSTTRLPKSFLDQFEGYPLADPTFHTATRVDLIIGMAHYHAFVLKEKIQVDNMWLIHTVMAWAVTGKSVMSRSPQRDAQRPLEQCGNCRSINARPQWHLPRPRGVFTYPCR